MKLIFVCLSILGWAGAQEASDHVLVQAHRGYSEVYPENTLLAIDKALEAGADRIEVDLALTSDGHVVLMHDRTVERTTDGEGAIQFMTLQQVKGLDAGSWKSPEFAGEQVPTLIEALELAEGRGELNLEIKVNSRSGSYVSEVIGAAVDTVQEQGAANRVIFSSFDFQALQQVKRLDPQMRVLLIDWDEASESFDWLDVAIAQGFYGWSPASEYATPQRLQRAEEAGIFVHVGAGPSSKLLEWLELGVDGFSANDPAALVDYLERRGLR